MRQDTDVHEGSGQIGFDFADEAVERGDSPASGAKGSPPPERAKPGSGEEIWRADLTRRLRVLLHTLPLAGMRRGDSMRDEELRHYDGLALALRVLDAVIDRLGLEAWGRGTSINS